MGGNIIASEGNITGTQAKPVKLNQAGGQQLDWLKSVSTI